VSDFVPVLLFYTLEGLHILVFGWILFKRFFSLLFTYSNLLEKFYLY